MKIKIPFGIPKITREEAKEASSVLLSGWLAHGPKTKAFEENFASYVGTKYAVAVSSCTAALHLSLLSLGIGPGDEVLVPAQTHVATAHSAMYVGAKPVFVDVDPATCNVTPETLKPKLTRRTKAINLVHFGGNPCDMKDIVCFARKHNLKIVEDCAHALGAEYAGKKAGSFGETGCFSFYPIKHITTGEGGMLVTNSKHIAEQAKKLRAFGIDADAYYRKKTGVYDVKAVGLNYRMTDIEAAIGIVQLKKAESFIDTRIKNAAFLTRLLKNIKGLVLPEIAKDTRHTFFIYQVRLAPGFPVSRDRLVTSLKEKGVGTSIYYATPVHLMTFYRKKFGYKPGDFPEAEKVARETFALPVHPRIGHKELSYIVSSVREIIKQK